MASLTISNFDTGLEQRLRDRASVHGRTVEAEAEAILRQAVTLSGTDVVALFQQYFGPGNGIDLELPVRGPGRPAPDFGATDGAM